MKIILVFLCFLCTTVAGVFGAAETCAAVDHPCGSNGGTCATECVATANVEDGAGAPTCTCGTSGESCSWKCQGATEKCAAVDDPCGSNGGKCATECVAAASVKTGTGAPTCLCATDGEDCSWKCQGATETCAAVDDPCGSNGGKCATECVAAASVKTGTGAPTCLCATDGQDCSWKCQVGGGGSGTHGQQSNTVGGGGSGTHGQPSNTGSGGKNSTTPKSGTGSIKPGLSPLILMCGILAKLFLSA